MDFEDRLIEHAKRVEEFKDVTQREEAAKTALVMPFLQMLGYDAFDPRVVVPEYYAHFGDKKAEKVDYAIKRDNEVIMLIETKASNDPLESHTAKQLQLYFNAIPSAKIGILTNGVIYKFFTDLERENMMDEKPFMIFDFVNIEKPLISELKKLSNDCFDLSVALTAAQDLKYLGQIKKIIAQNFKDVPDDLVKYFARQVCDKQMTHQVIDAFRDKVRVAFEHHVNDLINARLQGAMQSNNYEIPASSEEEAKANYTDRIVTTQDEWEAFYLVKFILRDVVDPARVTIRDTISYCNVLLDDKNTKTICRFHFNSKTTRYLETFGPDKKGTKHCINSIDDIFNFTDLLNETVKSYA